VSRQREWYSDGLRFACTQCGNCCTGPAGYVWFEEQELLSMAEHLGMTADAFRERYTRDIDGDLSLTETLTEHGYDCVFLDRDEQGRALCSIYEVRPMQCRTWPFWPENLRSVRSWVNASKRCPGMKQGLEGEGHFVPVDKIRILRDATG